MTKLFLDDAVAAGIITFSPANTSLDFIDWDDNGLYWRTAPSDTLQGEVLGNLLAEDGKNNVAVLYQNDSYGTGLNAVFKETFEASGGTVVEEQSYNTGDTTFDAQISAILASNPDAILLDHVRRDLHDRPGAARRGLPGREPVPRRRQPEELQCAGRHRLKWPAGLSLEGAKGTTPAGPLADEDFQAARQRLVGRRGQRRADRLLVRQRVVRRRHPARARLARRELDGPRRRRRQAAGGLGRLGRR